MTTLAKRIIPRSLFFKLVYWRDKLKAYVMGRPYRKGSKFAGEWQPSELFSGGQFSDRSIGDTDNPLWDYFEANTEGSGIWKWKHYFEIYHRHLARFIGTKVDMLEIGIFSGGSLGMWKSYFGSGCHIYGVDIEDVCKAYQSESVSVYIGDQEDPVFWDKFISEVPYIDVLIDDGGHTPEQQMVTLEKMLPRIRPGGVYICEDVHAINHRFSAYAAGLVSKLNAMDYSRPGIEDNVKTSSFQSECHSIHFYPFSVVIEKHAELQHELPNLRRGTQWQPFYE
jgi:hypothetical protein